MINQIADFIFALRNRHLFFFDLVMWLLTPILALWLRTDSWGVNSPFFPVLVLYVVVATITRFIIFRQLGLYSRFWRYASVDELVQILFALFMSTALLAIMFWWLVPIMGLFVQGLPRSIPITDGLLVFVTTSGIRFSIRFAERLRQRRWSTRGKLSRVAIFGAGDAGTTIAREMQRNPRLGLEPAVFFDSDPLKQGMWILGVPVVGDRASIIQAVQTYEIHQAIIAIPSASGKTVRELTQLCQTINLPVKTMPSMAELLDGRVRISQLRPVDIADLLRREPVNTDMAEIAALLQGKRILVTGAGGSIGSELCRQIAHCGPAGLVLLGHGENSIFDISNELRQTYLGLKIHSVIADVRDAQRLCHIFATHRPQWVFHTAAHKHVPLMEENVEDAITNNVLGTRNVLEASIANQVDHFLLISTDKAVNPTSIMGVTKRMAELLVQEAVARTGRVFVSVRFGNVLGSRGSVVPLFKEQIARGGPVTVTHPEVCRYFMTIPEAVQLVLQAAMLGKGGEIFALDMGEPIKIADLARELIRLSGLEEGKDIDIVYTGLRPGDKLFEELFLGGEDYERTKHAKIFVARNGVWVASSTPQVAVLDIAPREARLVDQVNALIAAAQVGDTVVMSQLLGDLVPEYQRPQN